jgi:hypothetical protein
MKQLPVVTKLLWLLLCVVTACGEGNQKQDPRLEKLDFLEARSKAADQLLADVQVKLARQELQLDGLSQTTTTQHREDIALREQYANTVRQRLDELQATLGVQAAQLADLRQFLDEADTRLKAISSSEALTTSRVSGLADQLKEAKNMLVNLQADQTLLEAKHKLLDNKFDDAVPLTLWRSPETTGFGMIWSNIGPMTIAVDPMVATPTGSASRLTITNLTSVGITGGKLKVEWGKALPSPASEQEIKEWIDSMQTVDLAIDPIDPGGQTWIPLTIPKFSPSQIGHVQISNLTFESINPNDPSTKSGFRRSLQLDPLQRGYGVVWSNMGPLTVNVEDITTFADGSNITLSIGNLTNGYLSDGTVDVVVGSRKPSKIEDYEPWLASLKSHSTSIPTIEAGRYNSVSIRIPGLTPAKLGHIELKSFDFTSVSLLVDRSKK